ncbi:CLAVATA3/ESR (CLE)-related protein 20 [Raphanus sativus]|uniref:CLAVATA3/ESR (CLE)-related protein 20 n=1 Tax=Raphanus sativus TaxID=3726 RepID=A0A6J0NT59_RAPSA|nr:CLAVATA3/ESR (CLE)-related protein 20 [Raphanus sativus]
MNRGRLLCLIGFLFLLVILSKASRIHVERRRFSPEPLPSQERGFLPSQRTQPVAGAGEFLPEKRKVKTGSNPLHNKR